MNFLSLLQSFILNWDPVEVCAPGLTCKITRCCDLWKVLQCFCGSKCSAGMKWDLIWLGNVGTLKNIIVYLQDREQINSPMLTIH